MALTLTQTDTAADSGASTGCSGATLAGDGGHDREATSGASAGSTEFTATIGQGNTGIAAVMFQSDVGSNEPDTSTWESGTWTVRLNVTTANSNLTWDEVYICEFNGGSSAGTVASKTTLGQGLGSTGTISVNVSQGSDYTPTDSTSTVYIVLVFDNGDSLSDQSVGITPDQDIDTPILVPQTINAGTSTATANALAGALDPGSLTISAGTSTATANALATDLKHILQTGVATATGNALAETLSATGTVTLSAGTSTATANALAGSIAIVLNAGLPSATANGLASTLSGTGVATVSANTASATANALFHDYLTTESGDTLTTEDGDELLTEGSGVFFASGTGTVSANTASASSTGLQAALDRTLNMGTASSNVNALGATLDPGSLTVSAGVASATANALSPDGFALVFTPGIASATANALTASTTGVGAASDMTPGTATATANALFASIKEVVGRTGLIEPMNITRPELPRAQSKHTHTGATQIRNRTQSGFRWTEEYGVLRMGDVDTEELLSLIESVHSTETRLKTTHPTTPGSGIDPNGTGTSGVTVNGSSQKGNTIDTTGWPASTSDVVVAGDVIKIDGFDRVFRVTSNTDSDTNGNATIDINPPIFESPVDGASVTTTDVEFECVVESVDNWPSVNDFYYDGLQVTLREKLDS